jgi:hypothetical protein
MSATGLLSKIRTAFQDRRKLVVSNPLVLRLPFNAFMRFFSLQALRAGNTCYAASIKFNNIFPAFQYRKGIIKPGL